MGKSIGILGGMGPLATCDLMEKIIAHTDASNDQEHIHIYVDCNTNIPDRTAAILHHGQDPLPEMVKSAVRLQSMGADVLVMPCNTAHYFQDTIRKFIDIPLLSMPKESAAYLRQKGYDRVAVLATTGTIESGIYDRAFKSAGIVPIYPNEQEQTLIMSLIYDCVKAGKPCTMQGQIQTLLDRLKMLGAQTFLLACTELPLAFREWKFSASTSDPTEILACCAIRFVGGKLK